MFGVFWKWNVTDMEGNWALIGIEGSPQKPAVSDPKQTSKVKLSGGIKAAWIAYID